MKLIGALLAIGIGLVAITQFTNPSTVRAQTVEAATNNLKRDQNDLRETATMTRAQASQLSRDVENPDKNAALPTELQAFDRTTERLKTLRERLGNDIEDYKTTYTAKLATFDQERAQITNPATQRSINTLRRHTEDDMNERLQNATGTLDTLDRVLAQGADLQHAAQCVLIANDLHTTGNDLDTQLKDAKTQANAYAATTTSLLARINTALAE
ncbi:MAG TPA: hypothetical protein VGN17_04860 [Bryobacteraceae bacterium]